MKKITLITKPILKKFIDDYISRETLSKTKTFMNIIDPNYHHYKDYKFNETNSSIIPEIKNKVETDIANKFLKEHGINIYKYIENNDTKKIKKIEIKPRNVNFTYVNSKNNI